MADFVLAGGDIFPVGTTVGVYVRPARDGAALGSQVTSAEVQSDSTATFTGLADATQYLAVATVSDIERRVGFSTPTAAVDTATQAELDTEATTRAAADATLTANTQTGDYTLVIGDAGKVVRMNKATAQVLTIPPQSSVTWVAGTIINVRRVGAGSVTITPGSGVTIPNRVQTSGAAARTVANQYGEAALHRVASDVWELVGDIA